MVTIDGRLTRMNKPLSLSELIGEKLHQLSVDSSGRLLVAGEDLAVALRQEIDFIGEAGLSDINLNQCNEKGCGPK